jgi:hypothetical protein
MVVKAWLEKARTPIGICVGNRLALFLVVYLGLVVCPDVDHPLRAFPQNLFLDGWFRWDSGHYLVIARDGYQVIPDSVQQRTNFWPLYPLLVRIVGWPMGDFFLAGFVLSNLALLAACTLLHRWTVSRFGQDVATRTLTLLLSCPFAFYFSAMYTESVFLLAVAGAFYFSQRARWLWASLFAAAAGATRLVGIVVMLPVAMTYAEYHDWKIARFRRDILYLPLGLAGLLGHMLFLHCRFGDAFAFLGTQWVPGWGNDSDWTRLATLLNNLTDWRRLATGTFQSIAAINLLFGTAVLVVCLISFRRIGAAACTWAVATMLVSLRIWASAGRYAVVVWPAYVGIALFTQKRPIVYQILVVGFCLLQALLAFWFAHGHWVA